MSLTERVEVLDIPVDFSDLETVVGRLADAAASGQPCQVATVNLDFLTTSQRDREVQAILSSTDINIPDGFPVVWAGRNLGAQGAVRVTGADLVPALVREAAGRNLGVFLLGGVDGVAEEAAQRLAAQNPGLRIDFFEPPLAPLERMDHAGILDRIHQAKPNILLVAFGHPKQEKWIYRHRTALPMVSIGVGCSLDLIADRQSRAPIWMQRSGLEWAYRLYREPRRLAGRYTTDALSMVRDLYPWVRHHRLTGRAS